MKKLLIPILIIIVAIIALILLVRQNKIVETPLLNTNEETTLAPISTFQWSFEQADTLNLDGQAQTNVYLLATYENGKSERKLIDTVDGSCSELPGKYEGDVSDTGKVQCYAAGLGQQYRITKPANSYVIEGKLFEEALPDSKPADYKWESVAEFSLMK